MKTLQESIMDDDEELDKRTSRDTLLHSLEREICHVREFKGNVRADDDKSYTVSNIIKILNALNITVQSAYITFSFSNSYKTIYIRQDSDSSFYMAINVSRKGDDYLIDIPIWMTDTPNKLKKSIKDFEELLKTCGYRVYQDNIYLKII